MGNSYFLLFLNFLSSYLISISSISHYTYLRTNLHQHIESQHTKNSLIKLENYLNQINQCQHIYLDVGTNIGIQLRKLYEPSLYPRADILKHFESFYGPIENRNQVCAIGIEPNPKWTKSLSDLESYYQEKGFGIVIFTETAANVHNKNMTFYTEPYEKDENHEWGASLIPWNKKMIPTTSGSISLSTLIQLIQYRKGKTSNSTVFMKLDVEGAEFEILSDLIFTGSICHVNQIAIEWHQYFRRDIKPPRPRDIMSTVNWLMQRKKNCPSQLIQMDDESYAQEGTFNSKSKVKGKRN
jgi:hypothetical protein